MPHNLKNIPEIDEELTHSLFIEFKRRAKRFSKKRFDALHQQNFLQEVNFEPIELTHWSFMGDKFLPEVKHILSLFPDYINFKNQSGDTALLVSSLNCSFEIFHYLYNFPNVDIHITNEMGNLVDNFFLSKISDEALQRPHTSDLEGEEFSIDYVSNTIKICEIFEKDFPTFFSDKKYGGNNLIFKMLDTPKTARTKLYEYKLKGLFLFLYNKHRDVLLSKDIDGNNLLHKSIIENIDDLLFYFKNENATNLLEQMSTELNNKGENCLYQFIVHEKFHKIEFELLSNEFVSNLNQSIFDIIEELLFFGDNKNYIYHQINGISPMEQLDKYIQITNEQKNDFDEELDSDIYDIWSYNEHFFNYVKNSLAHVANK